MISYFIFVIFVTSSNGNRIFCSPFIFMAPKCLGAVMSYRPPCRSYIEKLPVTFTKFPWASSGCLTPLLSVAGCESNTTSMRIPSRNDCNCTSSRIKGLVSIWFYSLTIVLHVALFLNQFSWTYFSLFKNMVFYVTECVAIICSGVSK